MGYFDLEDIIAEATPLSVNFTLETPNLGFLINQAHDTKIKPNETIQLPFWLVEHLAPEVLNPESLEPNSLVEPIPIISISVPDYISKRALNFYKASPTHAGLGHGTATGFYNAIVLWCSVMDDAAVREVVTDMLVARVCKIWDLATGSSRGAANRDNALFEAGLDPWERALWKACLGERAKFTKWVKSS